MFEVGPDGVTDAPVLPGVPVGVGSKFWEEFNIVVTCPRAVSKFGATTRS